MADIPAVSFRGSDRGERLFAQHIRQGELARQHAVNVIMLVYLVTVFDGVLRKYIMPEYSRELLFIRDPIVMYLYIHALRHRLIAQSAFLSTGIVLFVIAVVIVLVQLNYITIDPIFVVYGFRQYFSLLPLPFIMANVLRRADINRFIRMNLVISILMAPLMVLQVTLPPDSWINVGLGQKNVFEQVFYGQFARAAGFFTSAGGAAPFLHINGAIIILLWMTPKADRPCSDMLFWLGMIAEIISISVSGNRFAIVGVVLIGITAMISPFLMPIGNAAGLRGMTGPLVVGGLALTIAVFLFPDQFEAIRERWSEANENQGWFAIVDRAIDSAGEFYHVLLRTSFFGDGLGIGTNAQMIASSDLSLLAAGVENDWSRHIVDLGSFGGILYIAYRVGLVGHLMMIGIVQARRFSDPTALMFFAAAGHLIFYGTVTGQSTTNSFAWFFVGLILAAPNYAKSFR